MRLALLICASWLAQDTQVLQETLPDGTRVEREVVVTPGADPVNDGSYLEFWPDGTPRTEGRFDHGQRVGAWKTWYPSGAQASTGSYRRGLRNGVWNAWREDGSPDETWSGTFEPFELDWRKDVPRTRGETRANRRHGSWTLYWDNGLEMASGSYEDDRQSGVWVFRHPDGTLDPDWISGVYRDGERRGPLPEAVLASLTTQAVDTAVERPEVAATVLARKAVDRLRRADENALESTVEALTREVRDPIVGSELLLLLRVDDPHEGLLASSLVESSGISRAWFMPGGEPTTDQLLVERRRWASQFRLTTEPERRWLIAPFLARQAMRRVLIEQIPFEPLRVLYHPRPEDGFVVDESARLTASPYGPRFGKPERGAARKSLDEALIWLARHQSRDGSWDCDGFMFDCDCEGPGEVSHDVGVTGLALLAFLGDGHTTRQGEYRETVCRALAWLTGQQDTESGLIGEKMSHDFIYSHAAATLALSEALFFTDAPAVRLAAQRAIAYVESARNPKGAWRYEEPPNGDQDTSITTWMVGALWAAHQAGLEADLEPAFAGTLRFLDGVTDPESGAAGYTGVGESSSRTPMNLHHPRSTMPLTASSCWARMLMGQTPSTHSLLDTQAALIAHHLPGWVGDGSADDMYGWYYGSQVMAQIGGRQGKAWRKAMVETARTGQASRGHARGSWDPIGPWGYVGGRVYATAIMALCLEAPTRQAPFWKGGR